VEDTSQETTISRGDLTIEAREQIQYAGYVTVALRLLTNRNACVKLSLVPFQNTCTVTIRLYGTLAHFVAPVPAMHSHGAPQRDVLVSLPIVPVLIEEGLLIAGFKGPFSWSIA